MICSNSMRRSTASCQHTTAACLHIRKFIVFTFWGYLSASVTVFIGSKSKLGQSFVSSPEFHWSGTTLKSSWKEKHALPSWQRRSKQVPRTRPAWLWRTMSALRRRSIPLWWEGNETLTHSAGKNVTNVHDVLLSASRPFSWSCSTLALHIGLVFFLNTGTCWMFWSIVPLLLLPLICVVNFSVLCVFLAERTSTFLLVRETGIPCHGDRDVRIHPAWPRAPVDPRPLGLALMTTAPTLVLTRGW